MYSVLWRWSRQAEEKQEPPPRCTLWTTTFSCGGHVVGGAKQKREEGEDGAQVYVGRRVVDSLL